MHGVNTAGLVTLEVGAVGKRPTNTLVMPANPDQSYDQNLRVTIVQTRNGIYVDNFGNGIQTLQLSGTTAWNSPHGRFNGQPVDGNTAGRHLRKDIIQYFSNQSAPQTMMIYDDAFGQSYEVTPIGDLKLSRTQQSPTTLFYTMDFLISHDLVTGITVPKVPDPIQATFATKQHIKTHAGAKIAVSSGVATAVKQTPSTVYVVVLGDTLWTIAQHFLPKYAPRIEVERFVSEIETLNHLKNPNLIFPGERLKMPS